MTEIPFIFPSDIKKQKSILKGAVKSRGGKVGVPDNILTKNLLIESEKLDSWIKEWRKQYDFHLAEFQIDVNPTPDYDPEWVCISCSVNPWEPVLLRPMAKDLFPATKFVDANWKISGKFGGSASLGFDDLPSFLNNFEGKINGEAKIEFSYAPKIAQIDSGTSGSNFHWNFRKAENKPPTGGLDLKVILIRPRAVKDMQAVFEVSVKFDRRKLPWGDDVARASTQTVLSFNSGPI